MRVFTPADAECLVFTFKEGLLSPAAHDLKLQVGAFSIEEGEFSFSGTFRAASLRVVCAMKGEREAPEALSEADRRQIEQTIVGEVLETERFPEIRFRSQRIERKGSDWLIDGMLSLHGIEREVTLDARREGTARIAEARLHQPDFEIRPYRALMGALKLKTDVLVRIRLPA